MRVGECMCACFGIMCTCVLYCLYCVFLYCFVFEYLFLFVLSVLVLGYCHRVSVGL